MRFISYLNTAVYLIKLYDGSVPLVHFLKQYFAQQKKHGSKDRKYISHLCYCYYRLGHSLDGVEVEEKVKIALFLCENRVGDWEVLFDDEWKANWSLNLNERIVFVERAVYEFNKQTIFPWNDELSENIDAGLFSISHLIQPDLFIRVRPGHETTVEHRLHHCEIRFRKIDTHTLSFVNGTKLEEALEINYEVVIQDLSSQHVAALINPELIKLNWKDKWQVWDCCAASGGKSILLHDQHANNELLLSDVRDSMLPRLRDRLTSARIKDWNFKVIDLSAPYNANEQFDFIIADVPCTGSGTWSRTPEQMQFFSTETIKVYADKQKQIVGNVIPNLKKGGYFLYITCSVFKQENEDAVAFIQQEYKLTLVKQELFKGYESKADTMFAALFIA